MCKISVQFEILIIYIFWLPVPRFCICVYKKKYFGRTGNISNIEKNIENEGKATKEPYSAGSRLLVRVEVAASRPCKQVVRKYVTNKQMPKTSSYCVFSGLWKKPISLLCSYYLCDGNRGPEIKKIFVRLVSFFRNGFSDCGHAWK